MFDVNNIQDTGLRHSEDPRDFKHSDLVEAPAPFDWKKGFDCEKEFNIKIPFKNQWSSQSCVGNGDSYLTAVIASKQTGVYNENSAKAIYSQIFQPGGGATLRDAVSLNCNWGRELENIIKSYRPDGSTDEAFMEDKSWITPETVQMANALKDKSFVSINPDIESIAQAIRDYGGVILAVNGENNGTWSTNEPKPPVNPTWGHCLFFGKAGTDKLGKFISTPNSWGNRNEKDELHPDDWQKLRENWFTNGNVFAVYTLIDKINIKPMDYTPKLLQVNLLDPATNTYKPTKTVGYFFPAETEFILIEQAIKHNISLPTLNGKVDWAKVKIDGKAQI